MASELDRDFERMKHKAAIVLQDPDYLIYDSLVQWRIQELELEYVPILVPSTAFLLPLYPMFLT